MRLKRAINKVYLFKPVYSRIKKKMGELGIANYELAKLIGVSNFKMFRICNYNISHISKDEAKKLEGVLGITISDFHYSELLLEKIHNLEEENKRLKELLVERWKVG